MKKKTFFVTLFLFILFINSSMLIVSYITLRECMETEREKVLSEHYMISSALLGDMQAVEKRGMDVKVSMESLSRTYLRYSRNRGNELAVACGEDWICHDGDLLSGVEPGDFLSWEDLSDRIVFIEKKPDPRLCVYGRFPAPYQEYGLFYSADLEQALQSWRQMKNTLFLVSGAVTFLLALFLVKFLDVLFKPLREISVAARVIAGGDYHTRLQVRGKDEIAVMADNFNRMAEQVESHIRLLQDTADRKQRFIDNFAHELRTPLTAVYGYAEYIQKASLTKEEQFECTQFILSECKRLQNMAYQLLDMAALREIETASCPVGELFSRVSEIMQGKAEEKGILLCFDVRQEKCIGNRDLLITLLTNLIDNALKASSSGTIVRIGVKEREDTTILEVADQGIGMTGEQLSHIKEAFYRVDKSRSRRAGGAGLGLSICERIVQLHHGKLDFTSVLGAGTRACVALPAENSELYNSETE